jgi:hypothetical protein
MKILPGLLKQRCVYWPPGQIDKFGNYAVGNPVELACQWVNRKTILTNPNGKTFEVSSQVHLSVEVQEEGWLWLGKMKDRPQTPSNETKIRNVTRQPDTDNDEVLWIAGV